MKRLEPVFDRSSFFSALAALGLGALLLLQSGCANESGLVADVAFGAGAAPHGDVTPTPDPDPTWTPGPDPTPTPDPGPDPEPDPTPDPSPDDPPPPETPALACGTVVIRDLRISGDDANGAALDFRPWAELDLTDPDASVLNDLPISPGTYTRVRFTFHKRTGAGSGGPGTGNPEVNHSIHLCGTWAGIEWDYTDDTTDTVDRRDAGGVVVDADGPATLFVSFDSSTWFDGIDLSQAAVAPDGVVYLAHHENADLQRALRENIKRSIRLANHP